MNKENNYNITQHVMEQIKEEHITIRPRFYFIIGSIGLTIGLISLILLAVMLTDIATFHIRSHEPFGYLSLGKLGFDTFLTTFPFIPIVGALCAIAGGLYLMRLYSISYKVSIYVMAGALVVATGTVAYIVDSNGFNEQIIENKFMRNIMVPKYSDDNFIVGEILEATPNSQYFTITTPINEIVVIIRDDDTVIIPTGLLFYPGVRIKAVGEWNDDVFEAEAITTGGMRWKPIPPPVNPEVKGYMYPGPKGQLKQLK